MTFEISKYLFDLISRMNDTGLQKVEHGYTSENSISWKAYREAELLSQMDYINPLISLIESEKNKKIRKSAYFILGHIEKNNSDSTALKYLIERLNKETDKYVISVLLGSIESLKKPAGADLQPIIDATKSGKWLIRHSAIRALKNSSDKNIEKILIDIISTSQDQNDLIYSNSVLSSIGTIKSIPFLEKQLESRKRDVKASAKFAIEAIGNRT